MAQKNPHTKCGGFSRLNVLSSFSSLPFLALVFHLSLCFLTSLKPKSGPSNEVIGIYIYIYILQLLKMQNLRQHGKVATRRLHRETPKVGREKVGEQWAQVCLEWWARCKTERTSLKAPSPPAKQIV